MVSVLIVPGRRWTDSQLDHALRSAKSVQGLLAALGLKHCSRSSRRIREHAEALGFDTSLWERPAGVQTRTWSQEELERAVRASKSPAEALRKLGLRPRGGNYKQIRKYVEESGIDTSHWRPRVRRGGRRRTWSDGELRDAAAEARSLSETLRTLGLSERGGGVRQSVKVRIAALGLDVSHWSGQAHLRGKAAPWITARRRPLDELLVADRLTSNPNLRRRLVEEGVIDYACAICRLREWRGEPLALHLDHINGDNHDNRLENLRLLCPNCHSQTDSYCGRNWGKYLSRR